MEKLSKLHRFERQ